MANTEHTQSLQLSGKVLARSRTQVTYAGHVRRSRTQVTYAGHVRRSRTQVTYAGHVRRSRTQVTYAGHVRRSRTQVTYAGHVRRSRTQVTYAGHVITIYYYYYILHTLYRNSQRHVILVTLLFIPYQNHLAHVSLSSINTLKVDTKPGANI